MPTTDCSAIAAFEQSSIQAFRKELELCGIKTNWIGLWEVLQDTRNTLSSSINIKKLGTVS